MNINIDSRTVAGFEDVPPSVLSGELVDRKGQLVRHDFPLLNDGSVYLDSAATTLKPNAVIQAVQNFYATSTGAIGRAGHSVSERASQNFTHSRERIARFIGGRSMNTVLTYNASDAIMRVAEGLELLPEDEVIVSAMEHHSNLLPWRRVAKVVQVGLTNAGTVDLDQLRSLITPRTKLIAMSAASNVTGIVQPIYEMSAIANEAGIPILIDAAQMAGHYEFSMNDVGCTFAVMSGHKMLGPSGTGILAMSDDGAARLRPVRQGGGTVEFVGTDDYVTKTGPEAFEMGTPNAEGMIGLGMAIRYIEDIGLTEISKHVSELADMLREGIAEIPAFACHFPRGERNTGIVAFAAVSNFDIGLISQVLSESYDIALRHGHHCAQPFYDYMGAKPAIRASFHLYNTKDDVLALLSALREISPMCMGKSG